MQVAQGLKCPHLSFLIDGNRRRQLIHSHALKIVKVQCIDCLYYQKPHNQLFYGFFRQPTLVAERPIGPARTGVNPRIILSKQSQKMDVEVAQISQTKVRIARKGSAAILNPKVVWTATVKKNTTQLAIDKKAGTFSGALKEKKELATNQLYMIRLKIKKSDWTPWHSGFATQHADGQNISTLPQGYQINEK